MPTPPASTLDFSQCTQGAYDDSAGRLRVDAEITSTIISPPGLEISVDDTDDSIKIGNGSGVFAQVTGANALKVDGSAVTQPISAASLPLPAGASTSALQSTTNASLSSIDSKLTSPLSVTGTITANISGTGGLALDSTLSTLSAKFNSLGQKAMVASVPVVIASNQSSIPVTGTFFQATQPISGSVTVSNPDTNYSLETGGHLASIDTKLGSPMQNSGGSVSISNFPATQPISAVSLQIGRAH